MPILLTRPRLITVVASGAGIAIFTALSLPLPFLFGPMFSCLIVALCGGSLQNLGVISVAARTVLGVAIGASFTPALLAQIPHMLSSVMLIPLYIVLIGAIGVPYFRRVCGLDPVTAYYAAMPGGLQDMVIFGTEAGGNPRTLTLVHSTRVLVIVSLSPLILTQFYGATLNNPLGLPGSDIPPAQLALMLAAAIGGWWFFNKVGLFGASIIGPMLVAMVLSLGGLLEFRPPEEAILVAQALIGSAIGVYFVGVTPREFRDVVIFGLGFTLILALLAAVFAYLVSHWGLGAQRESFLAFAPGGQAEMTVLTIVAGADLGFVIVHHLTRIIIVILGAPMAMRLISFSRPRD